MIEIRSAEVTDAEHLRKIASQAGVQEDTLGLPFPSLDHWKKRLSNNGDNGVYHFVAQNHEAVVGLLTIEHFQHPRLKHKSTFGIFVDGKKSGLGIGSKLMQFCLAYSFDWLGVRKIELEVFADNQHAIRLYKKFGFEEEGVRKQSALRKGEYVDVLFMGIQSPHLP